MKRHQTSAMCRFITRVLVKNFYNYHNVSHSTRKQKSIVSKNIFFFLNLDQLLEVVDVRTPLRAEEENFSVGADDEDPEDPNSFLMENRNIHQGASGPSNSPLR